MKILKRIFLFLFILLLLLTGAALIVGYFYGDTLKTLVVNNLNKQLKTEVSVSRVDFSVWQNFPDASVVFSDVVIHSVESKNDTLLATKKLSANFNLIDIYQENYRLKGFSLSDGLCKMITDSEGNPNYIFWNESDSTSGSFSIDLESVDVRDMEFYYLDYSTNIAIGFLIDQMSLKGNFKNNVFKMDLESTIQHANVRVDQTVLLEERDLKLNLVGDVNQDEETLHFSDAVVSVDQINISVNGDLDYSKSSNINFQLASANADLDKAIALLPISIRNQLIRFEIDGQAKFNGNISGPINSHLSPAYDFDFSVTNGMLADKKSDLTFSKISLTGSINNGKEKLLSTTILNLKKFSAKLENSNLNGSLTLENFKTPRYHFKGDLGFQLREAIELFNVKEYSQPEGKLFATIEMEGRMANLNNFTLEDWKRSKVSGTLRIEDLGLKHKDQPQIVSEANGNLSFNNNSVNVDRLTTMVDNSSFQLDGKFNNLIGYIIDENEPLFVDANLTSPQINLEELLSKEESSTSEDSNYQLNVSPRITLYLNTKIKKLQFNQFKLNDLEGNVIVKNSRIDARGVSFSSQEGTFEGDLFIRDKGDYLTIAAETDLSKIDITKAFKSFNNFGQNTLRSEHISGEANAHVKFSSDWSKQLKVDANSISADIFFDINKGRLTEFKPLESLSTFIEVSELKDVKFSQLQNHILVKQSKITIPRFDIASSAINLSLAGTHTFENLIDYRVTLLLSEILGKKAKESKSYQESEFGYVEDDGTGKTKLFIKMTGSVDDPKIGYDTKALKNNFQKKFSKEKNTFKSLIKEEFGLFKNDTSLKPDPPVIRKNSPFQVELDSSYSKKKATNKTPVNEKNSATKKNENRNKSKFGKFLDKIAKPNEEEFVDPIEN